MSRMKNTTVGTVAAALVAAALVPSASLATEQARVATKAEALRLLDAQHASLATNGRHYRDLRLPDAPDAGRPQPSPSPAGDSTGTDWGDLGIGTGIVLALLGGFVILARRRGSVREPRTPAVS